MPDKYRVIANFGAAVAVAEDNPPRSGEATPPADQPAVHRAVPLSRIPQLVAGDRVECELEEGGSLRVVELLERDGVLARVDRRGQPKPLAANVSHMVIVSAAPPGIDTLLIDQFCIAAELAGIGAIVTINKADLLTQEALDESNAILETYRQIGYPSQLVNAKAAGQLAPLESELAGKTVVLVGASGVGKSSIVQALLPDLDVRVGAISAATGMGSHTTSVTHWYQTDGGASIIDSPGVRQYSVEHLSVEDVRAGYRELTNTAQHCKFADCSHRVEPSCAVLEALAQGEIAQWRYDNYRKLITRN